MNHKNHLAKLLSILSLLFFLLCWEYGFDSTRLRFLFASPSSIWDKLLDQSLNLNLPYHMGVTGLEAVLGFLIGSVLGTCCGFILWYSPLISKIAKPYLFVLGAIPVFAFAPIIIIWFGIGFGMKVAMAAFGTFLISLSQAHEGAQNVDIEQLRLMKILKASRFQILSKVIFPSSISWILNSLRLNTNFALLGAFIGEFISAEKGLGYFMLRAGSLYDIPAVFAGGLYLVTLALLFHSFVLFLENRQRQIIRFVSVKKHY